MRPSVSLQSMDSTNLSLGGRIAVLVAAFLGLLFDGGDLGLMPVASLSVTKNFMGAEFTPAAGGKWYAETALEAQARMLKQLGDLAPEFAYKNGRLIIKDAGEFSGGWTRWAQLRAGAFTRTFDVWTDIQARNMGANHIFDPAMLPQLSAPLHGGLFLLSRAHSELI